MKKKTRTGTIVFALIIVAVGVYIAALNIQGRKEVRRITETTPHADTMEASLKNYETEESVEASDPAELERIWEALSCIQYKGLCKGKDLIQPGDRVYSLILTAGESHVTMTLYPAGHDQSSYINDDPWGISPKNTDALYETLQPFFG